MGYFSDFIKDRQTGHKSKSIKSDEYLNIHLEKEDPITNL